MLLNRISLFLIFHFLIFFYTSIKPRGGAFEIFQRIYDIKVTGESKRKNQPASLVKIAPILGIIAPNRSKFGALSFPLSVSSIKIAKIKTVLSSTKLVNIDY